MVTLALLPHWLAVHALWPAIVLVAIGSLVLSLRGAVGPRLQIERKRLMTPSEVRFWHRLETALPDHRIFGQVSMGALLKPVRGLSRSDWWSNYGRYSQKIVDFVVVDAASGEVVAIVELDDASHNRSADLARDTLLGRGGYPVLRFDVRRFPSVLAIRSRFALGDPDVSLASARVSVQR